MKKIIFKTLILTVSLMTMQACSDKILDTEPLDKYTENVIWNDANLAQGFVYNSCNDIVRYFLSTKTEDWKYLGSGQEDFTDNICSWNTPAAFLVGRSQIDRYYDMGWSKFDLIREANMIIDKTKASKAFNDATKTKFIAQGKMLRAMIYFKQAELFGKYIKIDKVLTQADEMQLPRTPNIKDTYDFTLADLDYAAEHLPLNAENGELTKGFALALKAEVALQGAAYIESGQDDYYKQCIDASEALFALNKYSIDTDYKGIFNDYSHAETSPEIIFAMWSSSNINLYKDTPMQQLVPNCETDKIDAAAIPQLVENFVGWPKRNPTWDLTTAYLVVDTDGKAKKWDETSYYEDWKNNGGYISSFLWKNRDARFEASIAHDSSYLFKNLITTRVGGNLYRTMMLKGQTYSSRSGFWMRKCIYEQDALFAKNPTPYHRIIARLGRSYLNYAEALLRVGKTSEAIQAMNVTRTKHGNLPALSTNLSSQEAWKYYKIERRVELFYENGDRYWSLLRWAKADGQTQISELNHGIKLLEISADGKSFELTKTFLDDVNNTLIWDPKRFLFPVPQKQRELNNKLDQNPGW